MEFLKHFLDDDSHIIGLCGFKTLKPRYNKEEEERAYFFKVLQAKQQPVFNFETNYSKNPLLL